jgi:hypothetical protein
MEPPTGLHSKGWLLYGKELVTVVKKFVIHAPELNIGIFH